MSVLEAPVSPPAERTDETTPVVTVEGMTIPELIARARGASGDERAWLASLINKAVASMGATRDKERTASALLVLLDEDALHELEDDRQVACRAVAVESLLQIGYPWALQLRPEDVEFLREHPSRARRRVPVGRLAGGAAGVTSAMMLGVSAMAMKAWWATQLTRSPSELALVVALGLTTLASFSLVLGRPLVKLARWTMGVAGLVVAAVVGLDAVQHPPSVVHAVMLVPPLLGAIAAVARDKSR